MEPRIYTYKITFEEIPHWYWGVHKERKFGEEYLGSPVTHRWMWKFYTPKIQILEFFPYTSKGWKEAGKIEDRLISSDFNNPLNLNEHWGSVISLEQCRKGSQKAKEMQVGATFATSQQLAEWGRKGGSSNLGCRHTRKNLVEWAKKGASTLWVDPNHPELGYQNAGNLARMQRSRNLPAGSENRVKVTIERKDDE
jgi:hypothetical protein